MRSKRPAPAQCSSHGHQPGTKRSAAITAATAPASHQPRQASGRRQAITAVATAVATSPAKP